MTLETGLTALTDNQVELGAVLHADGTATAGVMVSNYTVAQLDGVDGMADLRGDNETDGPGDGAHPGQQWFEPKSIDILLDPRPANTAATVTFNNAVRTALGPRGNRTETVLLRWKLPDEPAKRLAIRPAARAFSMEGGKKRFAFNRPVAAIHVEAPYPCVVSDDFTTHVFTGGDTHVITNAGTHHAVMPTNWSLVYDGTDPLTLQNLTTGEELYFPAGPLTVDEHRNVIGPGTYADVYGAGGSWHPRWVLLPPGSSSIKASQPCTLKKRDIWP